MVASRTPTRCRWLMLPRSTHPCVSSACIKLIGVTRFSRLAACQGSGSFLFSASGQALTATQLQHLIGCNLNDLVCLPIPAPLCFHIRKRRFQDILGRGSWLEGTHKPRKQGLHKAWADVARKRTWPPAHWLRSLKDRNAWGAVYRPPRPPLLTKSSAARIAAFLRQHASAVVQSACDDVEDTTCQLEDCLLQSHTHASAFSTSSKLFCEQMDECRCTLRLLLRRELDGDLQVLCEGVV